MSGFDLLSIIVCPESKLPLRKATKEELSKLKDAEANKALKSVSGQILSDSFDDCLIRGDNKIAYMVRDNIPILLVEKGIDLSKL